MIRLGLSGFVLLLSALVLGSFAYVGFRDLPKPAGSDPIEAQILDGARRIHEGHTPYTAASVHGQPPMLPGYSLVVTAMAGGTRPELWQLRTIALGAALALALLAGIVVGLEGASWMLGLASAGFVLLGMSMMIESPVVSRPEILMLFLALMGFLILRHTEGVWGAVVGALPLAAACFVDHQAPWLIAAVYFSLALEDRHRLAGFAVVTGIFVGGGYVALSYLLGPWFNFSAWDAPMAALRFQPPGLRDFLANHVLGHFMVCCFAAVLAFALTNRPWSGKPGIWMCLAVGTLVGGLVSTQSAAFASRFLLPSAVALSILGPILVHRIAHDLSAWADPDHPNGDGVVFAVLSLQFFVLLHAVPATHWLPALLGRWRAGA